MKVSLLTALSKLVVAGEQAGFTIEELIQLLNKGTSVETILELITLRLEARMPEVAPLACSRWVM